MQLKSIIPEKNKRLFIDYLLPAALVLFVLAVGFRMAGKKVGLFVDEIYTFGLSNGHFTPFLTSIKDGFLGQVFTRRDFLDYMAVNPGEGFDFASVYYNQTQDVHPPLYYWLFNIAYSFFPGSISYWPALVLNIITYAAIAFVLYRLVVELLDSPPAATVTVLLYTLSNVGLSTMLLLRMYALITLFTVLLALLCLRLVKSGEKKYCPLIGLTIFLGLLSQYYFVFYAFFLCAFVFFRLLAKKNYPLLWRFTLWAFLGVGLMVAVFPACIDHLLSPRLVSGGNALENLLSFSAYGDRLSLFCGKKLMDGAPVLLYGGGLLGLITLCLLPLLLKRKTSLLGAGYALLLIAPAIVVYPLVAIISPVTADRYVYNLMPLLFILPGLLLWLCYKAVKPLPAARLPLLLAAGLMCFAALWQAKWTPPEYIFPSHAEHIDALTPLSQVPCVYLTDGSYTAQTQDVLELMFFDDVLMCDDLYSDTFKDYVGDSDRVFICVDTSDFWGSGFDPWKTVEDFRANTRYKYSLPLFFKELSIGYLLSVKEIPQ